MADQTRLVRRLLGELRRDEIDRREFMWLTAGLSATAFLAACSTGGDSTVGGSKRITVPFYTAENTAAALAFFSATILAYQKDHPNVNIPINFYNEITQSSFLNNAFRQKQDVGIFVPPTPSVPEWVRSGILLPLDDLVKRIGADDFYEGTRTIINGHDWHMPYQNPATGIWYRKDVLAQVGVNELPKTYDDLMAALAMVHGRNGMVGISSGASSNDPELLLYCMYPYIAQSGWGYFAKDGKLTFSQPDVGDAVVRYTDMLKKYSTKSYANTSYSDLVSGYVGGRVVFAHYGGRIGVNVVSQNPKIAEATGFGPEPAGPFMTGKIGWRIPQGYSIYARTQAPETAMDFLRFLTTGDNAIRYALTAPGQLFPVTKSTAKAFLDPTNKLTAADPYMSKPYFREWVNTTVNLGPTSINEELQMGAVNDHTLKQISNVNPFTADLWNANVAPDTKMVQQVVLAGMDARAAWREACTTMEQVAKKWLKAHPSWKPTA
jgi:ABC-type glycerol-3-phosphate transport system substrate-binding protein